MKANETVYIVSMCFFIVFFRFHFFKFDYFALYLEPVVDFIFCFIPELILVEAAIFSKNCVSFDILKKKKNHGNQVLFLKQEQLDSNPLP